MLAGVIDLLTDVPSNADVEQFSCIGCPALMLIYITGTRVDPFTRKDDERLGTIPVRTYSKGKSFDPSLSKATAESRENRKYACVRTSCLPC